MCVSEKERKKAGAEREVKAAAERESGAGRWVNHGWPRMAPDEHGDERCETGGEKKGGRAGGSENVLESWYDDRHLTSEPVSSRIFSCDIHPNTKLRRAAGFSRQRGRRFVSVEWRKRVWMR